MEKERKGKRSNVTATFKVGAIAIVFLVIGYQTALFVYRASVLRLEANRDRPDTVYVLDPELARSLLSSASGTRTVQTGQETRTEGTESLAFHAGDSISTADAEVVVRRSSSHSEAASKALALARGRRYESFRFNPNTASVDDLMRLGFSVKQAESIDNYRKKGGRFARKSDFAKSYVVADSLYRRLEAYIDIPLLDLNEADSAAFDALPGIGPYFAAKMVAHREELGAYSCTEQLMDIWKFDREKFDALKDLVTVSRPYEYQLWKLPEDSLKLHPYINGHAAHGIVLFRENNPQNAWTVENLESAGILKAEEAEKLSRCCANVR